MMDHIFERAISDAAARGPAVLMPHNERFRRPIDVVNSAALTAHDKRAILASWASDYYAVEENPAMRQIPETPGPVAIDEIQSALLELDRLYGI